MSSDKEGLTESETLVLFEECGALRTNGHFVYTSFLHGGVYVDKNAVIPYTRRLSVLCKMIADHFRGEGVQVVASPVTGGIALSQWVAYHYSFPPEYQEALAIYAEKVGDELTFQRGYNRLVAGKRVLIVDDIITTGGSMQRLMAAVKWAGGTVIGAGLLWNRGSIELPVPTFSLVNRQFPSWPEEECLLCQNRIPVNTEVGHGKQWLETHPDYPRCE